MNNFFWKTSSPFSEWTNDYLPKFFILNTESFYIHYIFENEHLYRKTELKEVVCCEQLNKLETNLHGLKIMFDEYKEIERGLVNG